MNLKQFCRNDVIVIEDNKAVQEAAQLMKEEDIGCVIVVANNDPDSAGRKKPIGILTDRDIAINVVANSSDSNKVKVADIMCKAPLTINHNKDVSEAIMMLQDRGVRRAPVLDENENLCGIVTLDDMLVIMVNNLTNLANVVQKQIHATT